MREGEASMAVSPCAIGLRCSIVGGAIGMLRPLKATLVALQFRHRDL